MGETDEDRSAGPARRLTRVASWVGDTVTLPGAFAWGITAVLAASPGAVLALGLALFAAQRALRALLRRLDGHPGRVAFVARVLRPTVSTVCLAGVAWAAGPAGHGWLAAVPIVFAHAMLSGGPFSLLHAAYVGAPNLAVFLAVGGPPDEALLAATLFLVGALIGGDSVALTQRLVAERDAANRELRVHNRDLVARQGLLTRSERAAREASALKSAFLANTSHEIRTPLNAVISALDLLLGERLPRRHEELAGLALRGARNLLALLNDLLDLSRIEAGKLRLVREPLDLRDLADDVVRGAVITAHAGVTVRCEVDPQVPDAVVGDPVRIRQVLQNLVSNAVKFTEQGSISVRVEVRGPRSGDHVAVALIVRDTGCGIPLALRDQVFEVFEQGDATTTRRAGGSGLGLALVRELSRMMGGDAQLDSVVGRGTTVTAWFHAERADAVDAPLPEPTQEHAAGRTMRVLLVEDNAINRMLAERMLAALGHEVVVAVDGLDGVERFLEDDFDVVLMDCHTPRLDGFEATRRLRADPAGATVPVFAFTASAMVEDRRRCEEAGMDGVLAKPIDRATLQEALDTALELLHRRADGGGPPAAPSGQAVVG